MRNTHDFRRGYLCANLMKEKLCSFRAPVSEFLQKTAPDMAVVGQQFVTALLSLFFLIAVLFHKTFAAWIAMIAVLSVFWHYLTIGYFPEADKPPVRRWLMLNLYLTAIYLGFAPYFLLRNMLGNPPAALIVVGLSGGLLLSIGLFSFQRGEAGKAVFKKLNNGVSSFGTDADSQVLKPGDVVLCDVKDLVESGAKDPREIIPYKDRFLHMLILGPTGGGKTSQVILPMVHQDVLNLEAGVTVIEPKGDLAREVAMMAKDMGRDYLYFDPSVDNCPFFNPLVGDEDDVIENAVTTFLMLNPDSPQYFKDLSEQLVRNALKVLKRLDKEKGIDSYYSTFIWMSRLLQNSNGKGRELVTKFSKINSCTTEESKENMDIASWFLNEYFAERSKIYENSSGIRSQVSKIIANQYLRHVLNPDPEKGEYNQIDFDKHLANGGVICISTAQGLLRNLGKFLGYFIILQFQSAVFRRPGNEDNRRAHFLYIDEFQTYSTPGFADMLTQGRSYRVASHLATQARAQIAMGGGRDGKNFVELVSTNARNIVIFPGLSEPDAEYYSKQFGDYEETETVKSYTRKVFNPLLGGLDKLGHPSESTREQKKITPRFRPSELIEAPFGEIIYCIIKKNSIQTAKRGKVNWLKTEYDKKLKRMIDTEIVPHEYRHKKEEDDEIPDITDTKFEDFGSSQETESSEPGLESKIDLPPLESEESDLLSDETPDSLDTEEAKNQEYEDNPEISISEKLDEDGGLGFEEDDLL